MGYSFVEMNSEGESDDEEEEVEEVEEAQHRTREAVGLLRDFSFLNLQVSKDGSTLEAYEMHRLVQEATQYNLGQSGRSEEQARFSDAALKAMMKLFPESNRQLWDTCERYMAHANRGCDSAHLCQGLGEAAELLTRVAHYLYERGRWGEEKLVCKRAYRYAEQSLGRDHPDTIRSRANLANVWVLQGRHREAEVAYTEAPAQRYSILGCEHPDTLWTMKTLEWVLNCLGKHAQAEAILRIVLSLHTRTVGLEHGLTSSIAASLVMTPGGAGQRP